MHVCEKERVALPSHQVGSLSLLTITQKDNRLVCVLWKLKQTDTYIFLLGHKKSTQKSTQVQQKVVWYWNYLFCHLKTESPVKRKLQFKFFMRNQLQALKKIFIPHRNIQLLGINGALINNIKTNKISKSKYMHMPLNGT